MTQENSTFEADYNPIAEEYAQKYFGELEHKPIDCKLLDRFGEYVDGLGPVCDLGCGPGQVARYLHDHSVDVFGLDLSQEMVAVARKLSPDIKFKQGDMSALKEEDDSLGGITAFYSIIHIPHHQIADVLRELLRVLVPGGYLLLAFHIGDEVLHKDEIFEIPVSIDTVFFQPEKVEIYLKKAGFEIVEIIERENYVGLEYESRRAFIFAQKPKGQ